MSPGAWPRPRVVVSACLGFAAVRYSGELIPDKVVAALKEHVDFVPVCPEVEIGLGVPRPVVRLVRGEEGPRMVQPKTGEDLTERMRAFSQRFLQGLGEVEGFLLKNRSPSCGLKSAGYRVVRCGPNGIRSPLLHNLSFVHDHSAVTEVPHHAQVMADEQQG